MGTDTRTAGGLTDQALEVIHHPDVRFYELLAEGQFAELIVYEDAGGRYVFTPTLIAEGYRSRGLSWALVRGVLEDLRQRHLGNIFTKAGITSRSQLRSILPADRDAALRWPPSASISAALPSEDWPAALASPAGFNAPFPREDAKSWRCRLADTRTVANGETGDGLSWCFARAASRGHPSTRCWPAASATS